MIKLINILPERYSHPICPRKQGESDEAYKLRCSPTISPSILLNVSSIDEKWSEKYKRSIDCSNPKGFSQRAHCKGRKKKKD